MLKLQSNVGRFHINFHPQPKDKSAVLRSVLCPMLLSIFCSPGQAVSCCRCYMIGYLMAFLNSDTDAA